MHMSAALQCGRRLWEARLTVSDYEWLESDERPGAWMGESSCFTFIRGRSVGEVVASAGFEAVEDLDLSDDPGAAEHLAGEGVAVFAADNGWTVIYQDNGFPDQFANALLASSAAEQGVVAFWNVNSVTEFSYWEAGTLVTSFDFPDDRHGSEPDRLLADMRALGLAPDEDEGFVDLHYAKMMALAERITRVRLGPNFLQRRLIVSRASEPLVDAEGGYMGAVVHREPTPAYQALAGSEPDLAAGLAAATPQNRQRAQDFLVQQVLRSTGLVDEPAAMAAAQRLTLGQPDTFPDDLVELTWRLDQATPPMGRKGPDYSNPAWQRRKAAAMLGDFHRRREPDHPDFGFGWQQAAWALDASWPTVRAQVLRLLAGG
jgi:hypothetical protein